MNGIEWIAAGLGLVNIALLVRRNVWNYPFGMAMVALYGAVFWEARLYSEAGLQGFFFAAQGWGWWLWLRAGQGLNTPVPVRRLDPYARTVGAVAILAVGLNGGWLLHRYTDAAAPYLDAPITVASIIAQVLLALRRVENWWLWIAIDVVSVGLYLWRGLYPTAGLYTAFLALAVLGLREWNRAAKTGLPA